MRFGAAGPVMIAGEGVETALSLRVVLPSAPLVAALTAAHLAALTFPAQLRRLYVARDADDAGDRTFAHIAERSEAAFVDIRGLEPRRDDFNSDLRAFGAEALQRVHRVQLDRLDAARFGVSRRRMHCQV